MRAGCVSRPSVRSVLHSAVRARGAGEVVVAIMRKGVV